MKNLKKLKSLVMLLVLAFCGSAFAAVTLPSTSAPTTVSLSISSATTATQWKRIGQNIGDGVTDVIISVQSDVDFGGSCLPTISMENANVYFIGGSPTSPKQVTISGLKQQNSLFNNVGKTVLVKDLQFKNAEYSKTDGESVTAGFLVNELDVDSFVVENVILDSFKVVVKPHDASREYYSVNYGVLAGSVAGNVSISNLQFSNCVFDTARVVNVGSLIGSVEGGLSLEDVQVSGSMNLLVHENEILMNGVGVGGIIGSVMGDVSLKNVKSNMDIEDSITGQHAVQHSLHKIDSLMGVGGIIGKIYEVSSTVNILGSEFSGGINSVTVDESEVAIGGIVGIVKNSMKKINVNNVNVTNKKVISHFGACAYVGGVFGALMNTKRMQNQIPEADFMLVNSAKRLLLTNNEDLYDGTVVGGLVGVAQNISVVAKNDVVSSSINLTVSHSPAVSDNVYVGGAVGAFWNSKEDCALLLEKDSIADVINVSYYGGQSSIHVGGMVGQVFGFGNVSISNSSFGKNSDVAMKISLGNSGAKSFFIGGLIGDVEGGSDVNINAVSVRGKANYIIDDLDRNLSYISGFIGLANNENTVVNNFAYEGDVVYSGSYTASYLTGSGILSKGDLSSNVSLKDGYVLCDMATSYTNADAGIDLLRVFLNDEYKIDFLPSQVYSISTEAEEAWYYDNKRAMLVALCENSDDCQIPKKTSFIDLKGENTHFDIYSDKTGEWNLMADGSAISASDLPNTGVEFSLNLDSMSFWKDESNNLWLGLDNLVGEHVFRKYSAKMPTVVLKTDLTKSNRKIEILDNADFDMTKDSVMPTYVFENGDSNGVVLYDKNRVWSVLDNDFIVLTVDSLKSFLSRSDKDTVVLVAEGDSKYVPAQVFRRYIGLENAVLKFRVKSLGVDDTIDFSSNGRYFPTMTELEVIESSTGSDCFQMYVNNVLTDTIALFEVLDMTRFSDDAVKFFGINCPDPASSSSSSEEPDSPSGGSSSSSDSPDNTLECIAASTISNVEFYKSGKSAALFKFKFNIPDTCETLTPSASVRGPEGLLWFSPFASKTKSYEFAYYPLEPGTYKFNVKIADGKDTTFRKTIKVDMSVSGHKWNLAAVGTWPKGVVDNDEAKVYGWSQDVLIGDYWQYEALPNVKDVVDDVGYWIYAEKNLEFSLDLPLKKAESDSFSWNLKKVVNGWNLIANPYSWDLDVSSVKNFMDPESDESPFWRYNASTGSFEVASVMGANEAFWISTDKNRTIKVCTYPKFPIKNSAKSKASAVNVLKKASSGSWSMVLAASMENGTSDSWNVLGVGSRNIALEEPPAGMNESIEVSFVGEGNASLAKSILAKSASEYSWNLKVKASESGKAKLSLDGLDEVRAMGYKAVLVMDGETFEFGEDASVSVDVSTKSKKALLKVVPASAKVVAVSGISDVRYSVAAGRMDVLFRVPFEMAGRSASVNLMDVNGKVISRAQGKANAGANALQIASPVRNGVYVLQVRVGSDSRIVRLAL